MSNGSRSKLPARRPVAVVVSASQQRHGAASGSGDTPHQQLHSRAAAALLSGLLIGSAAAGPVFAEGLLNERLPLPNL